MSEVKPAEGAAVPPSQDVYKNNKPRSSFAFSRGPRAAAGLVGGLFEATAAGFKEFREHLDDESTLRFGVDNGILEGAVAASSRVFEQLAQVSRDVYDELKTSAPPPPAATPQIDYAHLAKLVAQELQKAAEAGAPTTPAPQTRKS